MILLDKTVFALGRLPPAFPVILCSMYVSLRLFQVSTKTGVKLHYFNLHVLVPAAFILGSDEYHTQAGNAISLVCIIENVSGFYLRRSLRV